MSIIKGSNVILYFKRNNIWEPLACGRNITLTTNAETGETSTKGSGKWRTYRGIKLTWGISCDGLCSLDMNMSVGQLREVQFNLTAILISFTATDDNGLIESYQGYVIVTTIDTPASHNGLYEYSMTGQGSGELAITNLPIDPNEGGGLIMWYYYDGVGGEFTTGAIPDLVGVLIGEVLRDGIGWRKIEDNVDFSLIKKEVKHNTTTGEIIFNTELPALQPGETVDIPYQNP